MAFLTAQDAHGDRCNLCDRRFAGPRYYYQEGVEAPEPRQGWTVCRACAEAVNAELAQLEIGTPLRLRVALGMVAGERGGAPQERAAALAAAEAEERGFTRLVLWTVWIAFLVHALVFVAVVAVVAQRH